MFLCYFCNNDDIIYWTPFVHMMRYLLGIQYLNVFPDRSLIINQSQTAECHDAILQRKLLTLDWKIERYTSITAIMIELLTVYTYLITLLTKVSTFKKKCSHWYV